MRDPQDQESKNWLSPESAPELPVMDPRTLRGKRSAPWLVVVAWVAAIIGAAYSGLLTFGLGMSPGPSHISSYEHAALSIWPAIVFMAILVAVKRGTLTKGMVVGLMIPAFIVSPAILLSLSSPNWIAATFWGLPAAAFGLDLFLRDQGITFYSIETIFVAAMVLAPLRVLTHGLDFGNVRAQLDREKSESQKRMDRKAYFTALLPALKTAMPKQVGPWKQTILVGFNDEAVRTRSQVVRAQDGITALYEHVDSQSNLIIDNPELHERRIKDIGTKIKEYEKEYESIKGYDVPPNNWSPERLARLHYLRTASTALRNQLDWNSWAWRRWDDMEQTLEIAITMLPPGEPVDRSSSIWWELKDPGSNPGVLVPWPQSPSPGEGWIDRDVSAMCILGWIKDSDKLVEVAPGRSSNRGGKALVLATVGMKIDVTARDPQRIKSFVESFDLAPLEAIIRGAPTVIPEGSRIGR